MFGAGPKIALLCPPDRQGDCEITQSVQSWLLIESVRGACPLSQPATEKITPDCVAVAVVVISWLID